jgi:hypothetical protein
LPACPHRRQALLAQRAGGQGRRAKEPSRFAALARCSISGRICAKPAGALGVGPSAARASMSRRAWRATALAKIPAAGWDAHAKAPPQGRAYAAPAQTMAQTHGRNVQGPALCRLSCRPAGQTPAGRFARPYLDQATVAPARRPHG